MSNAEKNGIKAVALNSDNIRENPGIITKTIAGAYQLVFLSPEILSMENSTFTRLIASVTFRARLLGVVIDECHLCHQW
ncbi:MAG: hypothetical protein JWR35_3666 [Marmoricola sp.]|nr:hypothetical protein [Marmoricola sp.]